VRYRALKRTARRLTTLTAILLALGLAGAEASIVLCFGDDGHLSIEAVGPDGCVEAVEATTDTAAVIANPISSSHCGPCVDVAFSAPSATDGVAPAKRAGSAVAAISIATPVPPAPHLPAAISLRHSTPFISEKPNTIVIRC
jgi:hypothetical protein